MFVNVEAASRVCKPLMRSSTASSAFLIPYLMERCWSEIVWQLMLLFFFPSQIHTITDFMALIQKYIVIHSWLMEISIN